jgi:phosphatidylserine decarboxylase
MSRNDISRRERIFAWLQTVLPTHALSRGWLRFTRIRARWIGRASIRAFIRIYGVDLAEARETDTNAYPHLNALFIRALKDGARPLPAAPGALACPVDGTVSQIGAIDAERIIQAKNRDYSITALLGDEPERARPFQGGNFCTLYLAPHDYHRVHMPVAGQLEAVYHVPGRLFSVNPATVRALPGVFTRNERVVTFWRTESGPMAVVLVGALLVGSIETIWGGSITTKTGRKPGPIHHADAVHLNRGDELGRFNMGSSVILLFGPGMVAWDAGIMPGTAVRMGSGIGAMMRVSQARARGNAMT